jgi:hypothetical protein
MKKNSEFANIQFQLSKKLPQLKSNIFKINKNNETIEDDENLNNHLVLIENSKNLNINFNKSKPIKIICVGSENINLNLSNINLKIISNFIEITKCKNVEINFGNHLFQKIKIIQIENSQNCNLVFIDDVLSNEELQILEKKEKIKNEKIEKKEENEKKTEKIEKNEENEKIENEKKNENNKNKFLSYLKIISNENSEKNFITIKNNKNQQIKNFEIKLLTTETEEKKKNQEIKDEDDDDDGEDEGKMQIISTFENDNLISVKGIREGGGYLTSEKDKKQAEDKQIEFEKKFQKYIQDKLITSFKNKSKNDEVDIIMDKFEKTKLEFEKKKKEKLKKILEQEGENLENLKIENVEVEQSNNEIENKNEKIEKNEKNEKKISIEEEILLKKKKLKNTKTKETTLSDLFGGETFILSGEKPTFNPFLPQTLNDEEIKEYFDEDEKIKEKVKKIADLMKDKKLKIVIFTGAGISTSANIPDYRG